MHFKWARLSRAWQGRDHYQPDDWIKGCLPLPTPPLSWVQLRHWLAKEVTAMREATSSQQNHSLLINQIGHINNLYTYLVGLESLVSEPLSGDDYLLAQVKQNHSITLVRIPRFDYQVPANMAFLDWGSLTIGEEYYGSHLELDYLVSRVSNDLENLFGFGIRGSHQKGMEGYTLSYALGEAGWGNVALGGDSQRQTIFISLTGQGCAAADVGWEKRLQTWLEQIQEQGARAKLTRVDLTFDDYEGRYLTPVQAQREARKGSNSAFFLRGRPPSTESQGSWDDQDGKGKTYYIGSKQAQKRLKVYEKGKQLGDPTNPWVRIELTLRNRQSRTTRFELPLDILTSPGSYLAGAYSTNTKRGALGFLLGRADRAGLQAKRLQAVTTGSQLALEARLRYGRRAVGKLLNLLNQLGLTSQEIFDLLVSNGIPNHLKMPFNFHGIEETAHLHQPALVVGQVLDEVNESLPSASRRAELLRRLGALERSQNQ